jgi:hypothetical protein
MPHAHPNPLQALLQIVLLKCLILVSNKLLFPERERPEHFNGEPEIQRRQMIRSLLCKRVAFFWGSQEEDEAPGWGSPRGAEAEGHVF